MNKRVFIAIVAIIVIIAGLSYYALKEKSASSFTTSGIVEGKEVNLSAKISGRILYICCEEGDRIDKGAIAIKLESKDLEALMKQAEAAVARSESELKVSESAILNARALIESASASIEDASAETTKNRLQMEELKREMDRADALFREGLISREMLERAVSEYEISAAGLKSAKARYVAAEAKKESSQAQLDASVSQLEAAKKAHEEAVALLAYRLARMDDTVITSPMTGTVVYKALEQGETVNPGTIILTLVDMGNLYIRADIDETKVASVTLGGEVTVLLPSSRQKFTGTIYEIGRHAEFATQRDVVRGRQDIKTFRIKIRVQDTDGILKPGMTVEIAIRETAQSVRNDHERVH